MSNPTTEKTSKQSYNLKDIHEVDPLNEGDYECLAEVREILKHHGKRERLGVMLLHKHFDLAADEVLVEYTDPEARLLTITPMKRNKIGNSLETSWMLGDGGNEVMLECVQYCGRDIHGNHAPFHK
jgi:hypothetical protein